MDIQTEKRESEYEANLQLAGQASTKYHVFVKSKGKRKAISGPFDSEEQAQSHSSRKFGDGVCAGHMCEEFAMESIVDMVIAGQRAEANDVFKEKLSAHVAALLDARKVEIAKNLYSK